MKNIPKAKLLGVQVPFPPLSQQRAIADVLAGFDEHLANLDALIAKKKAVRDGALEELIFPVQLPRSQDTRDQAEVRLGELVYEISLSTACPLMIKASMRQPLQVARCLVHDEKSIHRACLLTSLT